MDTSFKRAAGGAGGLRRCINEKLGCRLFSEEVQLVKRNVTEKPVQIKCRKPQWRSGYIKPEELRALGSPPKELTFLYCGNLFTFGSQSIFIYCAVDECMRGLVCFLISVYSSFCQWGECVGRASS